MNESIELNVALAAQVAESLFGAALCILVEPVRRRSPRVDLLPLAK